VKEEVLISKSTEEEQRKLSAEAREEHADIHTEGDIERGRGEPKE
jgi:stress response protein YsnF